MTKENKPICFIMGTQVGAMNYIINQWLDSGFDVRLGSYKGLEDQFPQIPAGKGFITHKPEGEEWNWVERAFNMLSYPLDEETRVQSISNCHSEVDVWDLNLTIREWKEFLRKKFDGTEH